ncbi:MAG TPA: HAMP domain-containing sensor histidine kinase [Puia sp.]|nr:HAMP domain-containing sensor histidine kinase [Puia sp.]
MIYEITRLNLENEMDLILAHKRSIRLGGLLNLSISGQTAFTTAISECCREVIEKAKNGLLAIRIGQENDKFYLTAAISYKESEITRPGYGALDYAKKLVSQFNMYSEDSYSNIELTINVPKATKLSEVKIATIIDSFRKEHPSSPYEEVKLKKDALNKLAEEQHEQLLRSIYVNEKKTEFLSIASHELKTPLTTIKAFTQLALEEGDHCSDNIKMYLSKINTQSDKLYKLIQQLLDVSKVEAGQLDFNLEETPLNNYIRETVSLISKSIPTHNVEIEVGEDVTALVDKLRLEQVFSNILINAAKYSDERSNIRVMTSIQPGNMFRISIQDEGIGMTQQNIKRVFEKFFRAEEVARAYSGLGMGLYIASRIVAGHGGTIWIDSEVDIGSTFYFTIPFLHTVT